MEWVLLIYVITMTLYLGYFGFFVKFWFSFLEEKFLHYSKDMLYLEKKGAHVDGLRVSGCFKPVT